MQEKGRSHLDFYENSSFNISNPVMIFNYNVGFHLNVFMHPLEIAHLDFENVRGSKVRKAEQVVIEVETKTRCWNRW